MKEKIMKSFQDSINVKRKFAEEKADSIIVVSRLIADTFTRGNKLILFGNGGSSSDASHIAAEFVNRFQRERPALPALALNTDAAVLTSIANDYAYEEVFARQLKAFAMEGDIVIAISTSGNSPNVIKAVRAAKMRKLLTIGFTGAGGGKLAAVCDHVFDVPSDCTPRVQETHITLGHILCEMVEEILFEAHR